MATFLLMRRLLTALLTASLVLTACGDDDDDSDQAAATSIPDETTTSSTTTEPRTVAPDVIPQDESLITEEYVEQVLNELFEVSLATFTLTRDAGLVEEPAMDLIAATNSAAVYEQQVNDLLRLSQSRFEGFKANPSPVTVDVTEVLEVTRSCVIAEVQTDASGLMVDPPATDPNERSFVRLLLATDEQRSSGLNPTAWVIDEFPVTLDGSIAPLTCEAS